MLQKLINKLYRYPLSNWRTINRFGGYVSYRKMISSKTKMQDASKNLPPVISDPEGLDVYFLTGKSHLYQTLFCAYSLIKVSNTNYQFVLVDDGSFDQYLIDFATRQMPNVKLVLRDEIQENLNNELPIEKYPFLHHKRKVYPHIKKLTDVHTIARQSFKLVLDSDMLFWNDPIELVSWLKKPQGCLYMVDCEESYGYDTSLMKSLCGFEIPKLMNVGAIGINSNIVNWAEVEFWGKRLEEERGASYFLEQALSAMIVADENKTILSKEEYIVNPEWKNDGLAKVKLHHYVDLSKKYYFEEAWKKVLNG